MQFTAQEEYGLRCLLRLASAGNGANLTIPEISQSEGISVPYVAKMMRILRDGGLVTSERGSHGGYRLARPASDISTSQALAALGGRLFEQEFCEKHAGNEDTCTHSTNCSIRALWMAVQRVVDQLLSRTTIHDLASDEQQMNHFVSNLVVLSGQTGSNAATLS